MRFCFALLVFAACGGPTQQQVIETPSATAPARAAEAPPASTSDKDRERLIQGFEDMDTTQRAYREAGPETKAPPKASTALDPSKKAPVEQAPPEATPPK